jgi:2-polyprenyl-3-methyl-5-hydroxy-6-metoxy-1,4-benzoquinol methylase
MTKTPDDFPPCAVCESLNWIVVHSGPIRDGAFGAWRDTTVCRCSGCGVDRVAESACLQYDSYQTVEYRENLKQDHEAANHNAAHDELARFTLDALWPTSMRGKIVADVGCGGGALLDHVRGLASCIVAIDPSLPFSDSLKARGYAWYPDIRSATCDFAGKVDIVLSTQVIEHVDNPHAFLADIVEILKPDGIAVVSTPNRCDVLMEMLPDSFPAFFYRTQHRWAFDAASLSRCAQRAGLVVSEVKHVHRYGIANTMNWLKEGKPRGRAAMAPLDDAIDKHWQAWLEANGRADNLYVVLKRASTGNLS